MSNFDRLRRARDTVWERLSDPAAASAAFRWPEISGSFNWATDWFDVIAAGNDRDALRIYAPGGVREGRTFAELSGRSDRVAATLQRHGLRKGDPCVLMLGNRVELWEAMLGVMKAGGVLMPTSVDLGEASLRERIRRSGARHFIGDGVTAGQAAGIEELARVFSVDGTSPGCLALVDDNLSGDDFSPVRTAPDDPLLYYFTSGTTSAPKMVCHTHLSYPVGHLSSLSWMGLLREDRHLNISAPGWAKHAWASFFVAWLAESTIAVCRYDRFDPAEVLGVLRTGDVSSFCAPPTAWKLLLQHELAPAPPLRQALSAGEPLNPSVVETVQAAWAVCIREGYGQTETTGLVGHSPGTEVRKGSMGTALPGVRIQLWEPEAGRLAEREGELCVDLATSPPNLMSEYVGDAERTADAFAGGLYHTGDFVTVDDDGYFTFVGRRDDVFKSSDYKISPFELESVLIAHPAVAEAAIVPMQHQVRLAVPVACVKLAPGWEANSETARTILQETNRRLAPYQKIRAIQFTDLPKTESGKIQRSALRQRFASAGCEEGRSTTWRLEDLR